MLINICTDCANCTEYVNGFWCEELLCIVYPQVNPMAYRFCPKHKNGVPMKSEERIMRLEFNRYTDQGHCKQYQGA